MYTGNDVQAVQIISGGGYNIMVSSNTGTFSQQNNSGSSKKNSKGARGGSASKGLSGPLQSIAPVGRQVAYIDAATGNLMASGGAQTFIRPAAPQQSTAGRGGQTAPSSQPQQAVVQAHGLQQNGQQAQAQPQVLVHVAPAGPQVYKVKVSNGTRVVKAGQPYPNTTIVQTAMAVPTGPQHPAQQTQPQQQAGLITLRPQSMQPSQQQQQQQALQQQQKNQQGPQLMQVQLGGPVQLTASGSAQQQPQQAKLTLLQQAPPPHHQQQGVLVAQPQQQMQQQAPQLTPVPQQAQQQQQLLQGKQLQVQMQQVQVQQRQASAPAAFQAVAVRPGVAGGASSAAANARPVNGGPITLQPAMYGAVQPQTVTTTTRPGGRIPKLGTVATYNPVTGVRSATTTGAAGGGALPLLPANLPPTLVQQVQKANMLQQQQQQLHNNAATAAAAGGLTAVMHGQSHVQGQAIVRPVAAINGVMTNPANAAASIGAGIGAGGVPQQHQNQTALVMGGGVQAPPTQMGLTAVGSALQQQIQQPQMLHANSPFQVLSTVSGLPVQQLQQQPQQQQVVNITLADGTTATTVMDQTTLTRMLSESSRGQAVKLQQQQLLQQQGPGGSAAGKMQALSLYQQQAQQQQALLQAAPLQLGGPGLLSVLANGGGGVGGKGNGGSGGAYDSVGRGGGNSGGLQAVHLSAGTAPVVSGNCGPTQLLIRSSSTSSCGTNNHINGGAARGLLQPPPGLSQGLSAHVRTLQVLPPSSSQGNLQLPLQPQLQPHSADFMAGAQRQQQQTLLQLQPFEQLQHLAVQQQANTQQHVLQLSQQHMSLARRASASEAETAAALLTSSALGPHLQGQVGPPQEQQHRSLQQQQQPQQQQQASVHQCQQPHQRMSSALEGLSVVDLNGTAGIPSHLRFPQLRLGAAAMQQQQQQRPPQDGGGGGLPSSGLQTLQEDASAAAANATLGGGGGGSGGGAGGGFMGGIAGGGGGGSSREELKAILVSIGQELARHGISVETAVTSGWLGVLTAMDVAVLADAYTEEERRVMMQHKGASQQPQQQQLLHQQTQQPPAAGAHLGSGVPAGAESQGHTPSFLPPRQASQSMPYQRQQQQAQASGDSGMVPGAGDSRSGSSGDRVSSATVALAGLTPSSGRTSMSLAPSDDGASTASGGAATSAEFSAPNAAANGNSNGGAGGGAGAGGGMYDLHKSNAFKFNGFLGVGLPSALGGGEVVSEPDRLPAGGGGSAAERDMDTGGPPADVFGGEQQWQRLGLMAEEIGLSALPRSTRHPFPPPHLDSLMGVSSGGSNCGAIGGGGGSEVIDSASEYESRAPLLQQPLVQQQQHMLQPNKPGGGAFGCFAIPADRNSTQFNTGGTVGSNSSIGVSSALHSVGTISATSSVAGGGAAPGAAGSKGYSSAPGMYGMAVGSGGDGAGSSSGGPLDVDLDKEIENRFANLDLGCGFY